jgi:hypothetical protein
MRHHDAHAAVPLVPLEYKLLNPYYNTWRDLRWCAAHVPDLLQWLLYQVNPFNVDPVLAGGAAVGNELSLSWANFRSVLYVAGMTVVSVLMVCSVILAPVAILFYFIFDALDSKRGYLDPSAAPAEVAGGRTIFYINGIATTRHWFDLNVDMLTAHYRIKVRGIHNRSYGLLSDLLECVVQRNFRIQTSIVRQSAHAIRRELDKPGKEVLLVVHSQGGIIASLVMEALAVHYANRKNLHVDGSSSSSVGGPSHPLRRLSVLTLASAARFFINPHGLLPRLEHCINTKDLVGKSTRKYAKDGDIEGEVYLSNTEQRGHLLNAFYSLHEDAYGRVAYIAGSEIKSGQTPQLLTSVNRHDT